MGETTTETSAADNSVAQTKSSGLVRPFAFLAGIVVVLLAYQGYRLAGLLRTTNQQINKSIRLEEWSAAETPLRWQLYLHPKQAEKRLLLARVLAGKGEFVECAQILEDAASLGEYEAEAFFRAGQAWSMADRCGKAENAWRQGTQIETIDPRTFLYRRLCHKALCNLLAFQRRTAHFQRAIWNAYTDELPQNRHEYLQMLIRYDFEMVDPEPSIEKLRRCVEFDARDFGGQFGIGIYLMESGQLKEAKELLELAIRGREDECLLQEPLWECLYKLADFEELSRQLRSKLECAKLQPLHYYYQAAVDDQQGDAEKAIQSVQHCLEHLPKHRDSHRLLAQLFQRIGDTDSARKHLETAEKLEEAKNQLRERFELYSTNWNSAPEQRSELAHKLGEVLSQLGKHRQAQAWYRCSLSEDPAHDESRQALTTNSTATYP